MIIIKTLNEYFLRQNLNFFKTLKTYGKIDILVSNAAANPHVGNFLDITEEMWDKIFDINVKSAFLLTKEFLPHMNDGGSIIYISSVAAYVPVQVRSPRY